MGIWYLKTACRKNETPLNENDIIVTSIQLWKSQNFLNFVLNATNWAIFVMDYVRPIQSPDAYSICRSYTFTVYTVLYFNYKGVQCEHWKKSWCIKFWENVNLKILVKKKQKTPQLPTSREKGKNELFPWGDSRNGT